jgi:hypothetical protein
MQLQKYFLNLAQMRFHFRVVVGWSVFKAGKNNFHPED